MRSIREVITAAGEGDEKKTCTDAGSLPFWA